MISSGMSRCGGGCARRSRAILSSANRRKVSCTISQKSSARPRGPSVPASDAWRQGTGNGGGLAGAVQRSRAAPQSAASRPSPARSAQRLGGEHARNPLGRLPGSRRPRRLRDAPMPAAAGDVVGQDLVLVDPAVDQSGDAAVDDRLGHVQGRGHGIEVGEGRSALVMAVRLPAGNGRPQTLGLSRTRGSAARRAASVAPGRSPGPCHQPIESGRLDQPRSATLRRSRSGPGGARVDDRTGDPVVAVEELVDEAAGRSSHLSSTGRCGSSPATTHRREVVDAEARMPIRRWNVRSPQCSGGDRHIHRSAPSKTGPRRAESRPSLAHPLPPIAGSDGLRVDGFTLARRMPWRSNSVRASQVRDGDRLGDAADRARPQPAR